MSQQPPAAPIHVVHTGPRSTLNDGTTPYYEADIRPGQSLVMPGFTISIEAARDQRQRGGQPVVTVTPAEEDGQHRLTTASDEDVYPLRRQDQPASEHHPLAGVMTGSVRSQYRDAERQVEQDLPQQHVPHHHPSSQQASHQSPPMDQRGWAVAPGNTEIRPAIDNVQVFITSRESLVI